MRTLETLDRVAQENSTILTIPAELLTDQTAADKGKSPVKGLVDKVLANVDIEELMGGLSESQMKNIGDVNLESEKIDE